MVVKCDKINIAFDISLIHLSYSHNTKTERLNLFFKNPSILGKASNVYFLYFTKNHDLTVKVNPHRLIRSYWLIGNLDTLFQLFLQSNYFSCSCAHSSHSSFLPALLSHPHFASYSFSFSLSQQSSTNFPSNFHPFRFIFHNPSMRIPWCPNLSEYFLKSLKMRNSVFHPVGASNSAPGGFLSSSSVLSIKMEWDLHQDWSSKESLLPCFEQSQSIYAKRTVRTVTTSLLCPPVGKSNLLAELYNVYVTEGGWKVGRVAPMSIFWITVKLMLQLTSWIRIGSTVALQNKSTCISIFKHGERSQTKQLILSR